MGRGNPLASFKRSASSSAEAARRSLPSKTWPWKMLKMFQLLERSPLRDSYSTVTKCVGVQVEKWWKIYMFYYCFFLMDIWYLSTISLWWFSPPKTKLRHRLSASRRFNASQICIEMIYRNGIGFQSCVVEEVSDSSHTRNSFRNDSLMMSHSFLGAWVVMGICGDCRTIKSDLVECRWSKPGLAGFYHVDLDVASKTSNLMLSFNQKNTHPHTHAKDPKSVPETLGSGRVPGRATWYRPHFPDHNNGQHADL